MRQTALDCVLELARQDERVVFVGSDLGKGVMDEFKSEFPNRFFAEGISEGHLVSMCAGMALDGKIVYFNTIATFIARRAFEQVVLDLGLHKTKVRLIANGGGLVYAPLGPTHQAIDDLALMSTIPNMTVIAPADAHEMRQLMPLTLEVEGPVYIRLGKGFEEMVTQSAWVYELGKGRYLKEGKDAVIVTTGVTLQKALKACLILEQSNIHVSVLHLPTVKPLDKKLLLQAAKEHQYMVTVEEHLLRGGLGSMIAEFLMESDCRPIFKRLGIDDQFSTRYGSQDGLMDYFGIGADSIVKAVLELHHD
jgi:transketolase